MHFTRLKKHGFTESYKYNPKIRKSELHVGEH